MDICLIGLDKAAAPAAPPADWPARMEASTGPRNPASPIRELVVVETDRRIELYAAMADISDPFAVLGEAVAAASDRVLRPASVPIDFAMGADAALHLFRIACGDSPFDPDRSMAEASERAASEAHACGACLTDLFGTAVDVARKAGAASSARPAAASAIAELCERLFGSTSRIEALVVGASEGSRGLSGALEAKGFRVVHRAAWPETLEEASRYGIIAASSRPASGHLETRDLKTMRRLRRGKPLAIFDMSDGGTVASEPKGVDDIFVYGSNDLAELAGAHAAPCAMSPMQRRKMLRDVSRDFELRWKQAR